MSCMDNIIATVVVIAILGSAIAYIIKSKKNGQKCIGCPYSKTCSKQNGCNCESKGNKK